MNLRPLFPVLIILTTAFAGHAARIAPYRFPIKCSEKGAFLPYVSSHLIGKSNAGIDRVIVGIHSSGFDALKCYTAIQQAAEKVRGAKTSTLIVAPQFFDVNSIKERIPAGLIAWKVSPYRGSSLACVGPAKKGLTLSAYDAVDQLLAFLNDKKKFPQLKTVVLAGHSSGGQMAHRYALVGKYNSRNGVPVHYVPSAPSSFAYLSEKRPVLGSENKFAKPSPAAIKKDPAYNNWGYGLASRYRAFRRASEDYIRGRYARRRVLYLCGSKDNNINDRSLSKVGAAMLQGRHRLERVQFYYQHLIDVYGQDITKLHSLNIAPGVDHNGFRAYASPAGLRVLFGYDPRDSDGDGISDWEEWLAQ